MPLPATARAKLRIVESLPSRDEELPDADLVLRARSGDHWALEMLYRRHVQLVAGTALRLLRNRADAEDVAQETFLLAFEKLSQLAEPAAFRGWLVRIAVSRVHRRFRARKLRGLLLPWRDEESEETSLEAEAREDATPEQRVELALLDRALAALPLELRTPWLLRHVMGCAVEETAAACGCSLATVKRRISAADEKIRLHTGGAR
jgi:RNA polymerase sigma-70 factor (ECF subfamily)